MNPAILLPIGVACLAAALVAAVACWRHARRAEAARREHLALSRAYAELAQAKADADARAERLDATLSGMSDGVMMMDAELRLVQWNERFPRLTGVPRGMLRAGLPMEDMLRAQAQAGEFGHVDVESEVRRRLAYLRETREQGVVERARPNGEVLELRRNALPGGGYVTLYSDITGRKRAEAATREASRRAAEAVAQRGQFVAMVSHEVRAPLDALIGSLDMLVAMDLPQEARARIAAAHQAGIGLLELVDDILDFSRIDAGKLPLREGPYAARPMIAEVVGLFAARAAARDLTLRPEIEPGLPERLIGDGGRVRQVLTNLVGNAVKFSRPGPITILAGMAEESDGTGGRIPVLRLAVRDQGPRLSDQQVARLFQPFVRIDLTETGGAPGTGLGLAICERVVRAMNGRLGIGRAQPDGNEFWVTLPHRTAAAPPPRTAAPPARDAAPQPALRRRRGNVLLVEDLLVNQMITATQMRREGHRVDVAGSGREAIEMVQRFPYDLVLMDLMMPEMSGYDAARAIRALPGPAGQVPMVALTATTTPDDHAACLAAGMSDMLTKPVHPAALSNALAATIWSNLPAASPRAPLLDHARLDDLRRNLPDGMFATLAVQCLEDMRARLVQLRHSLGGSDPRPVEEHAHALAGMSGGYGMTGVERRMRAIMAAARATDLPTARQAASGMGAELDQTETALRTLLRAEVPA